MTVTKKVSQNTEDFHWSLKHTPNSHHWLSQSWRERLFSIFKQSNS